MALQLQLCAHNRGAVGIAQCYDLKKMPSMHKCSYIKHEYSSPEL